MALYHGAIGDDGNEAVNENGDKPKIEAGKAFVAAIESDSEAKQSLANALMKLRMFAASAQATMLPLRPAMDALNQVLAGVDSALLKMAAERRRIMADDLAELRAEKERVFTRLEADVKQSKQSMRSELETYGFDLPVDLDGWEDLAVEVEREPDLMTLHQIYRWAIGWTKRELRRRQIDRGELPIQKNEEPKRRASTRSAEEASIFRDEHDAKIAWCAGKRIYLGDDTQISRLFWLLASPLGRACSLGEVQRAVDDMETTRDMDESGEEYKKAGQRVRKALSKLRARLIEAGADDHLFVHRGGNRKYPEYTMVLRFD